MPTPRSELGTSGERLAEEYLVEKGYKLVERNFRKPWGEIDLVLRKNDMVVFCEVKTRDAKHVEHYPAESSVNHLKKEKLRKICEMYLTEKRYDPQQKWQIDVIAVALDKNTGATTINHIENAVWEEQY